MTLRLVVDKNREYSECTPELLDNLELLGTLKAIVSAPFGYALPDIKKARSILARMRGDHA